MTYYESDSCSVVVDGRVHTHTQRETTRFSASRSQELVRTTITGGNHQQDDLLTARNNPTQTCIWIDIKMDRQRER